MTEAIEEVRELPKGWIKAKLGEVVLDITYGHTASSTTSPIGPKFLRITDLQNNSVNWEAVPYCECNEVEKYKLKPGDIVVARTGATTGKSFLLREIPEATIFASYLIRLQTSKFCSTKHIALFMQSLSYWKQITAMSKGTAQPGANASILSTLSLPIPPLNEQERIIEKIEELFSDVDQGVESLKTAQKQLKVYRQAVLKWAFEGKLTEAWREKRDRPSSLETGEALLAQIKAERFSNYQGKHSDPLLAKVKSFQSMPESWCLVTLDQISIFLTSGSRGWAKYYSSSGSYFIRAQDINTDELKLRAIAHVSLPGGVEGERTRVQAGDILITLTGANVTKTALVNVNLKKEAYVSQHVGLVRLIELVSRKFVYWWLISSQHGRAQLTAAAYGAGKPGLNLTNLKEVLITLPPVEEQEEIIQEIELRLSICDRLEATIIENLQKAEALRQSILKQAFEGKLVPQDPNDEPAEKLLERIKQEQAEPKPGKQLSLKDILEES